MIIQQYLGIQDKNICVVEVIPALKTKGRIMFISGYGQCKSGYFCMHIRLAKILCENGYHSILYDHPGLGDSSGDLQQYSWIDYKQIALELSKIYMLNDSPLYYLGIGVGANIAIQLSETNDAKVIGIANWLSRYPSLSEMGLELSHKIEFSKLYDEVYTSNYMRILGGSKHHTSGFFANPMFFEQLAKEKNFFEFIKGKDIMLAYGEHDFSNKIKEQYRKIQEIEQNGGYVAIVKDSDRFFSFADWQDQLFEYLISWLQQNE